jgi:general secretion pathway protein E
MQYAKIDPRSAEVAQSMLDFAQAAGKLDAPAALRAKAIQARTGDRIDFVLTELGLVSAEDVLHMTAAYLNVPVVDAAKARVNQDVLDTAAVDYWRRNELAPLVDDGGTFTVVGADPFSGDVINALSFALGKPLQFCVAPRTQIMGLLAPFAEQPADAVVVAHDDGSSTDVDVRRLRESASEAPIVRLVNRVIMAAVRSRASDIHFDSFATGLVIRLRIDGVLVEHERVEKASAAAVTSRVKIMSGLNIAEHRVPQDGRILTAVDGRETEIRVAITPVLNGESIVLRLVGQTHVNVELAALGLDAATHGFLTRAARNPHGIILVTGPTGSGKSTTLYALLKSLNNGARKIVSIEDPVELAIEGVTQIPARPSLGLGFADALRTVLRHDPDVIMVGEMRDKDTARAGMQAALTGHMVLSTLHTNSATDSITRLLDLGIEPFLISATLTGIISQRLVRRLCGTCAVTTTQDTDLDVLRRLTGTAALTNKGQLRAAAGCETCHGTGFFGRTTIAETFVIDSQARDMIAQRADATALRAAAEAAGLRSLAHAGLTKVLDGTTTAAEILKAIRVEA